MTDLEEARGRILPAAVRHVPFDGWSPRSLALGTRDAGYDPDVAERAFPGGIPELITAFSRDADARMMAAMADRDLSGLKVRERVALGVRLRLEGLAGEREAVRHLTSYCALPGNAALGARLVAETVDAVWYAAGDESTDFSYYTKRGLLAAVYAATALYWLSDESEGFRETWDFLDRRLGDVMQIPRLRGRLEARLAGLPSPARLIRLISRRNPLRSWH